MSFYERHRDFVEELERIAPEGGRIEWSGDTRVMQSSPPDVHRLDVTLDLAVLVPYQDRAADKPGERGCGGVIDREAL
ncbi:hypothetical protein ACFZCK_20805 [Kitasatospora purpeofusca]|uniref:hypothetical protein n=1 Tax=Kitasatospora purpeofusca TaxID=67352 RepID=UPI0036E0B1FE